MRGLALSLALLATPYAGFAGSPTESPLSGTWIANLEKSHRHENHQFQSATLTFAVSGDTVTLTHEGVNAGGEKESGTTALQADGKEHPTSEQTPDVVAVTQWAGPRRLEIIAKKGQTKVGGQSFEVSADGKTLTTSVWGTDASGRPFEQTIAFDRK
jgi:endonuclease YncB( thermonuclease family)